MTDRIRAIWNGQDPAAERARRIQQAAHLRDVRGQAGQLLVNGAAVGEQRHLLRQPLWVGGGVQLRQPLREPRLIRGGQSGRQRGQPRLQPVQQAQVLR